MPDLSKAKIGSPIRDMGQLQQNTRGEVYGSRDTLVGRWIGGNYYDEGLRTYDEQQNLRYANQGRLNAFGNFAADLGVKTLSGIPSIIGGATGLIGGTAIAATGGSFADGFDNNPFLNMSKAMNTWGDEYFPHNVEESYQDKSFTQKLFTAPGQLATSNVSTLGFLAQSFGLAGLLSKAGVGSRVIQAVSKGKSFKTALSELAAPDLAKKIATIDELTLNTFLTTNEAAMEAQDAHDTIIQKLQMDRINGLNNLSDGEIKGAAMNSMGNVFWENMLTTGLTNTFFTKLVRPMFSPKSVSTRENMFGLKALTGKESFAEAGNTKLSKFEKFLFDKGHTYGMATKSFLGQSLSEGLEENIQYSIQKVNDAYNRNKSFGDAMYDTAKDLVTSGLDFTDKERGESVGLGALIGGGSVGIASLAGFGPAKEARDFADNREKAIAELQSKYTDFLSASTVKKSPDQKGKLSTKEEDGVTKYFNEEEDKISEISQATYQKIQETFHPDANGNYTIKGKHEIDENGNVLRDAKKVADFAKQAQIQSEFDDLIDAEAAKTDVDNLKVQLYQLSKLGNLAQTAFKYGATDMFLRKLESYKTLSDEELAAEGLDRESIDGVVSNWTDHVNRLEKNYLSTHNSIVPFVTTKQDKEILEKMRDTAADIGSRIVTLDRLILEANQQLSQAIANSPKPVETQAILSALSADENIKLDDSKWKEAEVDASLGRLVTNIKEITTAREQLGEIYTKLLDPKNGFKNYKKATLAGNYRDYSTVKDLSLDLPLNDLTTAEDLGNYETRNISRENHQRRTKYARSLFFSDAINKFVKFMDTEGIDVETADSAKSIVDKVFEGDLMLYPDQASKLKGIINTIENQAVAKQKQIEEELLQNYQMPLDEAEINMDGIPEVDALMSDYYAAEEILTALGDLHSKKDEVFSRIDKQTGYPQLDLSETSLRKSALDKLLLGARNTLEAADLDEEYDDISRVDYELKRIEALEKLFGSSDDSLHKQYANTANKLKQKLLALQKEVNKRRADRDLKNKKQDEYYASGHLDLFNQVPKEVFTTAGISATQLTQVQQLASVDSVLASKITAAFLSSLSKEELQKVASTLEQQTRDAIRALKVFDLPSSIKVTITDEELESVISNPGRVFPIVFSKILDKEERVGSKDLQPLEEYVKDYDIVKFISSVEKIGGVTTVEEYRNLISLQSKLIALESIHQAEAGSFNEVEFLNSLIKSLEGKQISPSSSQLRVVRELAIFLKGAINSNGDLFTAGAALKAPAGAGKSLVVASILKATAGYSDGEIITAAPLAKASENIQKATSSTNGVNTVDELTDILNKGAIPTGVKAIIVDEAGALTSEQIYQFGLAVAKFNRENPARAVKFVLLYDPNQITTGNTSKAALDAYLYKEPSALNEDYFKDEVAATAYRNGQKPVQDANVLLGVPFVQNLTQITPLSTTYRSDVSEIVDLQNRFKTKDEVASLKTASSTDPKKTTKNILGTYVETSSTIDEVVTRSQAENPARSRVVIVGSAAKKDKYKALLPGVEVLTAAEAQGITVDEVYVDIQKTDGGYLDTPAVYNQFMYTATSRASKFLHVANFSGTTTVDTEIPARVADVQARAPKGTKELQDLLGEQLKTIQDITKQTAPIPSTPVVEQVTEEQVEEAAEEVEQDQTADFPYEAAPPIIAPEPLTDGAFHKLENPSSIIFDDLKDLPPIKAGEVLRVVKDITQRQSGLNEQRYLIVQDIYNDTNDLVAYRIAAILGDAELKEFTKVVPQDVLDSLEPVRFKTYSSTGKGVIFPADGNPVSSFAQVYVHPSSHDLIYHYDTTSSYNFGGDTNADGKLERLGILNTHLRTMFGGTPERFIPNYQDVLDNFENYTQIIAFKSAKEASRYFGGKVAYDKLPKPNIPYLIIKDIPLINGTDTLAPQYIRLTPAVLNMKTAPTLGLDTDSIVHFLTKLKELESMIPKMNLGGAYSSLKNGTAIKTDNTNTYYPFHFFVTQLSKAYQALSKGESWEIVMSPFDHIKEIFPVIDASTLPMEFLKLGYDLDVLVHGEAVADRERRSYKGAAQVAFDAIGSQNLIVTLPNGKHLVLKDYRNTWFTAEGREVTESAGMSLLGPLGFVTSKGLSYNSYMKPRLVDSLAKYLDGLVKRGEASSRRAHFLNELLQNAKVKHLQPITTEDLIQLFELGQDANGNLSNGISEGFGIRQPMMSGSYRASYYTAATIKDLVVAGQFETSFTKVTPTQLIVSNTPAGAAFEPLHEEKVARPLSPLDNLRRAIREGKSVRDFPSDVKADFTAYMEVDTFDEAVALYESNLKESIAWESSVKNIYQALKHLKNELGSNPAVSPEIALQDIRDSIDVVGVGKGAGKTAARDFIRGAILLRTFPSIPASLDKLGEISDFARTYYIPGRDDAAFEARLMDIAEQYGYTPSEVHANWIQVINAYQEISEDNDFNLSPGSSYLAQLQFAVMVSHELRSSYREASAAPITTDGYREFLQRLVKAADSEDAFENILSHPDNEEYRKRLEKEGDPEKSDYENANDILEQDELKRSMLFLDELQDIGDLLTDEEVEDYLATLNPTSPLDYFKRLFRSKSKSKTYRIVEFNSLQNAQGQALWGQYKSGLMEFARHKTGRIGSKVVRHEFFHKVFWEYLSPAERLKALQLAQQEWGKLSALELEERMADSFADYKLNRKPTLFRRLWDKLLQLLGFSLKHWKNLPELFELINKGSFKNKGTVSNNIQRSMLQIGANFDSLEQFQLAKSALLGTFSQLEKQRKSSPKVYSFHELVQTTFDHLSAVYKTPEKYLIGWSTEQIAEYQKALGKLLVSPKDRVKKAFIDEYFGQTASRTAALNMWEEQQAAKIDGAEIAVAEKELALDPDNQATQDEYDEALAELEGLKQETFDSELRDPKIKLTGNVKQRLVSIQYSKDGRPTYAEFSKVFSILLNKVSSIPTSSLSEALSAIQKEFALFTGLPGKLKTSIREATGKFMLELVQDLQNELGPNSTIPKNVTFKKDINFKGYYAIVGIDGSDTSRITIKEAEQNPLSYRIVPQDESTSVDTFVTSVATAAGVSKEAAAKSFYFYEDLDFVKSLLAAVSSLRENRPHVAYSRWEWGRYKAAYFRSRMGGGSAILETKLLSTLSDYADSLSGTTLFPEEMMQMVKTATTVKDKREAFKAFMRVIGLKGKLGAIDSAFDGDVERVFESFRPAISTMQSVFAVDVDSFENIAEWRAARNASTLLGNETSFVQDFVGLLNFHHELAETNSYIRGDGKKAYGFVDESYQSSVLTSITRALAGKAHRAFNTFQVKNGKFTTSDRFLRDNIFFTGHSTIKSFIDHDSLKNKGNERFARYLRKESALDFDKRHITFGFFSRLRTSKSGHYYQFLPIPSNRTSIQAVEVKAMNKVELEKAYRQVIKAQKNRPSLENNPDLAAAKGYKKNYKQWKLGPLNGSVDSVTENEAWNLILKNAEKQSEEIIQNYLVPSWGEKAKIPLDDRDIVYAYNVLTGTKKALPRATSNSTAEEKANYVATKNEMIKAVMPLFYLNFGINNYSLSQLLYGDEVFYGSKEVETKRIQIATATGDTLLIDDVHGLPPMSRILVVKDATKNTKGIEGVSKSAYGHSFDSSDAEGYMLPEFYEKIAATYGMESLTDVVLKPVYFSIENGIPTAVKYSVKVLTDAVVATDPVLAQYRDMMRAKKVDQLTFASAVKVGAPLGLATLDDSDFLNEDSVSDNAVITLDNRYLRFQLNPAKSPEITTANPSQGTAFMNTNGLNTAEAAELHRLNAMLIENGLRGVFRDLRLTVKGGLSGKSEKELKRRLAKSVEGVPGSRDIYNLLTFKGSDKVSLSLPLIADRVVSTLSSIMTKATTGFRFAGSKLVLQADLGKRDVYNNITKTTEHRYLQFRDAEGFCEVILPESYANFYAKGDKLLPGNQNGIVGFRIPSTNYHSLLPLKVVGFYKAPKGAKANVVIAPKEIVYFHGSDYDVDTLFTIRKEAWSLDTVDLADILNLYAPVPMQKLILEKDKSVVGFDENGSQSYEGQALHDFLNPYLDIAFKRVHDLTYRLTLKSLSPLEKDRISKELAEHNQKIDILSTALDISTKNHIVDLFVTNMRDPKNRADLLTAISFSRVASLKVDTKEALEELLKTDSFLLELKQAGLIDNLVC